MTMIQLIACIGMIAGLFMVLGISPAEMSDSIFSRLTAAPGSIRADINETTKRKKAGFFRREITEAQANAAYNRIKSQISNDIEVTLVNGGQPVYYFIISFDYPS